MKHNGAVGRNEIQYQPLVAYLTDYAINKSQVAPVCLMSEPTLPDLPLVGLSVCSKEDEDQALGVVLDVDNENGNLIIRGNMDLRTFSIPQSAVAVVDQESPKIVLDISRDDFIEHEVQSSHDIL